jgi:quinol monooxygenase YgiN
MIVVSGLITFDPEKYDRAVELIDALCAATRAEDGCISYEFFTTPGDPGRSRVFEEWESEEALTAHQAAPHLADFYTASGELGITSAELYRYEVTSKTPL